VSPTYFRFQELVAFIFTPT